MYTPIKKFSLKISTVSDNNTNNRIIITIYWNKTYKNVVSQNTLLCCTHPSSCDTAR